MEVISRKKPQQCAKLIEPVCEVEISNQKGLNYYPYAVVVVFFRRRLSASAPAALNWTAAIGKSHNRDSTLWFDDEGKQRKQLTLKISLITSE